MPSPGPVKLCIKLLSTAMLSSLTSRIDPKEAELMCHRPLL